MPLFRQRAKRSPCPEHPPGSGVFIEGGETDSPRFSEIRMPHAGHIVVAERNGVAQMSITSSSSRWSKMDMTRSMANGSDTVGGAVAQAASSSTRETMGANLARRGL